MNAPANDTVVYDHSPARSGGLLLLAMTAAAAASSLGQLSTSSMTLAAGALAAAGVGVIASSGLVRLGASAALVLDGRGLSLHGLFGTRRMMWSEIAGVEQVRSAAGRDELILHPLPGRARQPLRIVPQQIGTTPGRLIAAMQMHAPQLKVAPAVAARSD